MAKEDVCPLLDLMVTVPFLRSLSFSSISSFMVLFPLSVATTHEGLETIVHDVPSVLTSAYFVSSLGETEILLVLKLIYEASPDSCCIEMSCVMFPPLMEI